MYISFSLDYKLRHSTTWLESNGHIQKLMGSKNMHKGMNIVMQISRLDESKHPLASVIKYLDFQVSRFFF